MKRMLTLTKTQLLNLFFQSRSGKKSKIPPIVISCLVMFGLSLYYSWIFADMMETQAHAVPYMVSILGTVIIFMSGISGSQGMLFGFKDYDSLMALPVTERDIVTSKIVVYTFMQYLYSFFLVIPAMLIHGYRISASVFYYFRVILCFLPFPLLPMVLSALIGIAFQKLTAGKRYGKLLQNGLTIAFIALVYYFSFSFGASAGSGQPGMQVGGIAAFLPSAKWYVEGVINADIPKLLLLFGIGIAVYVLFILIYSRTIIRVTAQGMQGYHVANFRLKKVKRAGSLGALMRQEWQRYFNNFTYFLNTSMGMIVLMIMSIYVIFIDNPIKDLITELMIERGDVLAKIWQTFILAISCVGSMTCTTGVSISLEGKSLWILKSIPADVKEIFLAKIMVNVILIMVPSTLSLLGLGIAFHLPLLYYIVGIVMLAATALFISMLGLLINLRFPKLEFDREVVVIKQSLSAFLSIMIPMFLAVGIMVLFFMTGMNTFYWIMGFFVAADLILVFLLLKYGTERFRRLA